jgi:DNA repair ATPase RecN
MTVLNLPVLQELSMFLIDIHSQQQTRELSDENVQFDIIDLATIQSEAAHEKRTKTPTTSLVTVVYEP